MQILCALLGMMAWHESHDKLCWLQNTSNAPTEQPAGTQR